MRGSAAQPAGNSRDTAHRALERVVPAHTAKAWVERASNRLYRTAPRLSARSGVEFRQIVAIAGPLFFILVWSVACPPVAWVALGTTTSAVAAILTLRLAAAVVPPAYQQGVVLPDSDLPVVTVLAPMFRESAVLDQLVRGLERIDYPAAKLDIKLIVEAIDCETLRAVRGMDLDARFEIVVVPDGQPRTKPRALNYAMRLAAGSVVCIYDAEDMPHPRQIRTAVEVFAANDDSLACLQAPLGWYNRQANWLTRQFALEYAAHFHAFLPLLSQMGWPLPLGGTSNFFRRDALEAAGSWDPYNVTEDADLGFRLAAKGLRTGVIAPATLEEAPIALKPWIGQRTRWIKGHAQTFAVHTRDPQSLYRGTAWRGAASLSASLGATVLSALLHVPAVLACLIFAVTNPGTPLSWAAPVLLAFGYGAVAACAWSGARRAGFRPRLFDLLTMPAYWPLQMIAGVLALWELRSDPYFWSKTEHGLSPAPETETPTECPSRSPSSSWPASSPASSSAPGSRDGRRIRRAARA